MSQLRSAVKLSFALLAVWLGLVWAGLLPRPAFLPRELDIEPLTFLLGTIAALLFGFWKSPAEQSDRVTDSHPVTPADESLQTEIRKYLKSRYEHRIRQKLAGREPVNLRKIPSSTGTSDEGAQNFITLPAEKVPSGMAELFDEARGRLLVVGAPGAGKTTLLLQLALALLERPGKDLPVLLNLATWRSEFAAFDDWLQRILPLELGASKALAEKIRRNTPLILLLDGLDEVPEDARASCLKAIGEYGAEASRRFVVSCRKHELEALKSHIPTNIYFSVEAAPLTVKQIENQLSAWAFIQPEAKSLLNALKTDPLLREAIANPFYLNTAQLLFATGRKYSDFGFAATDVAGRQQELVERFVEDALGRKVKREYPKEKARKWLGYYAVMAWPEVEIEFAPIIISTKKLEKVKLEIKNSSLPKLHNKYLDMIANMLKTNSLVVSSLLYLNIFFLVIFIFSIFNFFVSTNSKQSILVSVLSFIVLLILNVAVHLLMASFSILMFVMKGYMPFHFSNFLNEMSLRHLLEFDGDPETGKGGGSWRWRHRIIQEYFLSASAPTSQALAGKKSTGRIKEVRGET